MGGRNIRRRIKTISHYLGRNIHEERSRRLVTKNTYSGTEEGVWGAGELKRNVVCRIHVRARRGDEDISLDRGSSLLPLKTR